VTALVLSIIGIVAGLFALIVAAVAFSLEPCDSAGASFFEECYAGSTGGRVIGAILCVLGAIASVFFLVYSIQFFSKSRRRERVLISGIATVLLIALGFAIV
jgi:hypothetical protein